MAVDLADFLDIEGQEYQTVGVGTRVYYRDGRDKQDTGTIVAIVLSNAPFVVQWDRSENADEKVDSFTADQLGIL